MSDDIYAVFRERILNRIGELELTQHQFAMRAGMSDQSVSQYVNGSKVPNTLTLIKLAKALGVTPDYLLGFSDNIDNKTYVTHCHDCAHRDVWGYCHSPLGIMRRLPYEVKDNDFCSFGSPKEDDSYGK